MDKATKALANKVTALEKLVHALQDASRENAKYAAGPEGDSTEQRTTGPKESSHANGDATNGTKGTKTKAHYPAPWWIGMWAWKPWKRILGVAAGLAGIAYAGVT